MSKRYFKRGKEITKDRVAFISDKTYQKLQRHRGKSWADKLLIDYEKNAKKLKKYYHENMSDITPAENAFKGILDELGVGYEREKQVSREGRHFFIDFFVRAPFRVGFEIDGAVHRGREAYDTERDILIMADKRFLMHRFTNDEVLYSRNQTKQMVHTILIQRAQSFKGLRREKWLTILGPPTAGR